MKAKQSANSAILIINEQNGGVPDAIFMVGVGRAAECPTLGKAWPDAKWFGCEPHPLHHAKNENFPGAIFPVAVTGKNGHAAFYLKKNHSHGSSVFSRFAKSDKQITTPTKTLNSIHNEKGPFGKKILLWMDCEGSELSALDRSERFLKDVRWINIEMMVEPTRDGWPDHCEVHGRLVALGFIRVQIHSHNFTFGAYDAIYMRPEYINWKEVLCPCSHAYRGLHHHERSVR